MADTPTKSRRRFSLRTLFVVVTVVACWLGYQFNWIRQRHEILASYSEPDCLEPRTRAPLSLALLGEGGYGWIQFEWAVPREKRTREQYYLVKRLFPEAFIGSGKQIPWNGDWPDAHADQP